MDNRQEILVSVIVPTYNYAHFISEAIESVLKQTYSKELIEIIVIDDGSEDNTQGILSAYGNQIKYIYQSNSGKAWATKIGIENSSGKYIFNLDADDLFLPDKIKEVVDVFESDDTITHVAHPAVCWYVQEEKKNLECIPEWMLNKKNDGRDVLSHLYKNKILFGGGSTFAARRDILTQYIIPKEVDMFIDEYLVLIPLNQGFTYFINKPLSIWRIHGANYSNKSSNSNTLKEMAIRSLKSIMSVRDTILENSFPQYVKILYVLRTKIDSVVIHEKFDKKSFKDVLRIWYYLFSNLPILRKDIFSIIINYTLINRSIPTSVLKMMKRLRNV